MTATIRIPPLPRRWRAIAVAMCVESAALAAMSALHLSGVLAGASRPFDSQHAGIAEALICIVLAAGATALMRRSRACASVAAGAICFAILGFLVGLYFSVQAGAAIDLAFHATLLPVLALTLATLLLTARTPHL